MWTPQVYVPLIAVLIAGTFALRQIRSNNITNARIKWLDNLKSDIAEFMAECMQVAGKNNISKLNEGVTRKSDPVQFEAVRQFDRQVMEHLKMVSVKFDLIKLNLNPKEPLHRKLELLLENYLDTFNQMTQTSLEEDKELYRKMKEECDLMVLLTRHIMKLEWERIKNPVLFKIWYLRYGEGKKLTAEALSLQSYLLTNPNE